MPPKFAELTDFASRTFVNYDDDAYNDNSNIASHRMISSPRRRSSNQQQQQQHTSDMSAAPLLMTIPVPTSARDVARTIETSRRYTSLQMLSILAFLANIAFLLLALRGYLGDGTLYYYVIVLYHTKLTPAWWTFLALPVAWLVDLFTLLWFAFPYPKSELLYRRRWARSIMPGFTVTWICEIGWVFALLYDLPWLALVFAFLACIALFAAWYTSVALSAIGLEFADHHDGADSHNYYDDEYDDDNGPGADVVDRGEDFLARADLSNQPDALDVAPASDHDGADAESIGDANSLRRPSSTMSHSSHGTMRTAASALDVHDEPHAHSMNFVNASHALGRRLALERALRRRAWPLARIPLAVHFGVALLRAVINMQIVAVNQFVLIPQSTVYEAIVVTGLSFFTLCVLCISAWQADAIVPTICSLGLFSIAFGPRSCFIPDLCTDNDVVLISQASVTLAGILGVEVLVIVAVFIVRRWRRRHSASADR